VLFIAAPVVDWDRRDHLVSGQMQRGGCEFSHDQRFVKFCLGSPLQSAYKSLQHMKTAERPDGQDADQHVDPRPA
jgi:hypothetical protein